MSNWINQESTWPARADVQLASLEEAIVSEAGTPQLLQLLGTLRREDLKKVLQRFAEQSVQLALRLGKPAPSVQVNSNGLHLDPVRWQPFWNVFPHVVRNMVDHGIETVEERIRGGKSDTPTLRLCAELDSEHLVVRIFDDGAGIDWSGLEEKRRQMGLTNGQSEDLQELLFAEGLSIRNELTETSGRGVGLSVVRRAVLELEGQIEVSSERGISTEFVFRMPLSGSMQ